MYIAYHIKRAYALFSALSNSTFAWWGAWLGKSEGQTVITPQTWFLDRPTPDTLCPEEWIRIPNSISPRVAEKLLCH